MWQRKCEGSATKRPNSELGWFCRELGAKCPNRCVGCFPVPKRVKCYGMCISGWEEEWVFCGPSFQFVMFTGDYEKG